MSLLIKGGTVVTADQSFAADVYCVDGKIAKVGADLNVPSGTEVIDAVGQYVMPGAHVSVSPMARMGRKVGV